MANEIRPLLVTLEDASGEPVDGAAVPSEYLPAADAAALGRTKRKKYGGRVKGSRNVSHGEAKTFAKSLVDDPRYRDNLRRRMQRGKVAPVVEMMLWHYAAGKPREEIELDLTVTAVSQLSDHELLARLQEAQRALKALDSGGR